MLSFHLHLSLSQRAIDRPRRRRRTPRSRAGTHRRAPALETLEPRDLPAVGLGGQAGVGSGSPPAPPSADTAVAGNGAGVPADATQPTVDSNYASDFALTVSSDSSGQITQMAWGPDGRLYAATTDRGVESFAYDPATGVLSDPVIASNIDGLGIAFQQSTGDMYLSSMDGSIYRLSDDNHDGIWGEPGEVDVPIVRNLPVGDHDVDNIQIIGNTLYVGIGDRTINGGTGPYTGGAIDDYGGTGMFSGGVGDTYGESAYNGTISTIQDLDDVPDTPNAAGLFQDTSQATIQTNSLPFTDTDPGKLVVYAAGTRNPFGLAVDDQGNLYFTNNYDRAQTNGDGTATLGWYADDVGPHLSDEVYDQFFEAVQGADYGFRNTNWRGNTPILTPGSPGYDRVKSITFDNLYSSDPNYLQQDYNPSQPIGLGPSSSSDGLAFSYNPMLQAMGLYGDAFIARYNSSVTAGDGTTFTYADLVAVDPKTGEINQVASGFVNPLAVIADANGNLLVADYGAGTVYRLSAAPTPPQPSDAGFETPSVGTGSYSDYVYDPTGTAWTFSGGTNDGSGVAGNGSGFTAGNPAAPEGTQVAFLQGTGAMSQAVAGWAAGTYAISFDAAQRANYPGTNSFQVLVDGDVVGTFTPTGTSYQVYTTAPFTVGAGSHTITFQGLDDDVTTAFVDDVQVAASTVPMVGDAGFETPSVGTGSYSDYVYDPTGTAWTFSGGTNDGSGVAGNGSGFTAGNPAAPEGTQVAFLQGTGAMSQAVAGWAAGTYAISFDAAQRASYPGTNSFQVLVDGDVVGTFTPTGTSYQVYTTAPFTVGAGSHTITFQGLDDDVTTAFVDDVLVIPA